MDAVRRGARKLKTEPKDFYILWLSFAYRIKKSTPNKFGVLARRKGFEPLTFWSVARRSIQLS